MAKSVAKRTLDSANARWASRLTAWISALIVSTTLLVSLSACALAPDVPSTGSMSPAVERLGDEEAPTGADQDNDPRPELRDFIASQMESASIPGLSVAVVHGGQPVWAEGFGFADLEAERPVTIDTSFLLASVSKTVTAVALMQAVEEGALDLNADLSAYLPFSLRHPTHPDGPVTLRMLLTHTAGIRDNWDVLEPLIVEGDSPIALADWAKGYFDFDGVYYDADNFLPQEPGTHFEYSNAGTALAGYLLEHRARRSFEEVTESRIFTPLGMADSAWRLADLDLDKLAVPYADGRGGKLERVEHYGFPDIPNGALRSSALDMARFLAAVAGGGVLPDGTRILKAETVAEMLRPQIPTLEEGMGLVWYREGERLGHTGGELGASTRMFFRDGDGAGVVLLANGDSRAAEGALEAIEDRLFEAAKALAGGPPSPPDAGLVLMPFAARR